jgi:hypothetical protein
MQTVTAFLCRFPAAHAFNPNINRAALAGAGAVRQMADDLRTLDAAGGATEDNMRTIGWRDAQLKAHAEAARSLAQTKSVSHA